MNIFEMKATDAEFTSTIFVTEDQAETIQSLQAAMEYLSIGKCPEVLRKQIWAECQKYIKELQDTCFPNKHYFRTGWKVIAVKELIQ